ncbi:hypothetical protein HHI36_018765 [Cryptolaemus montrouzieri]|uniref:Chitin-binding type-2 domain-containing protein n=1 Tax=Cryptolaemus montrouzieri TaxID=559131 RepID=A0ABD2P0Y4_9CUCU
MRPSFQLRTSSVPKTSRRTTSVLITYSTNSSTTERTIINRRKNSKITNSRKSELNTPKTSPPRYFHHTSATPRTKLTTRRGNIALDQSLQSSTQQLLENTQSRPETTELAQIAFTLLQQAPLPSLRTKVSTVPYSVPINIFTEATSPRTRYTPATAPMLTPFNHRFVQKRPPPTEITRPSSPFLVFQEAPINYPYNYDQSNLSKYTKVIVHSNGNVECLDQGNFPHPTSCKKFISCAKMENEKILGWEYTCPKNLSFDPIGGICNWSAETGCNEKR